MFFFHMLKHIAGSYTVMGVTSFGEGCGDADSPGVYTNVKALMPWIRQKLQEYG